MAQTVDGARLLRETWAEGLRPPDRLTVAEWADRYRILTERSAAEPGPWRTARTPYLREIMESLSPSDPVHTVVFLAGSQIGKTEVGLNWIGYTIDHDPGPMMIVYPTLELAKGYARQRLEPMIEEQPRLVRRVFQRQERLKGNTWDLKLFVGGVLKLAGANSGASLRSMPAQKLYADEIDAYGGDADGEGDPVRLAERALRTYESSGAKMFLTSTPKMEHTSRILRWFEQGDQRRYFVPCPFCGHRQVIAWDRIRWEKSAAGKDLPEAVTLACEDCGVLIDERHKTAMLAGGEWRPTAEPENAGVRSYHLSALYSPLGWYSWRRAVEAFLKAKDDVEELKVWTNQTLGEAWRAKGDAPDWQVLYDRREQYPEGTAPAGALVLTAGIDVQKDRLEVEVVGWGPGRESWSIAYHVFPGDVATAGPWELLDALLASTFPHESGVPLPIDMAAVDTGYETQRVYGWARQHVGRVIAVKGRDNFPTLVGAPAPVDVLVGGRKVARGLKLWTVSPDLGKAELYGYLRLPRPEVPGAPYPPGFAHFPLRGEGYFQGLCSEQRVAVRLRGGYVRQQWEKLRERNEPLDCRVYARCAAAVLGIDRWDGKVWEARRQVLTASTGKPEDVPRARPRRDTDGGFWGPRWQQH